MRVASQFLLSLMLLSLLPTARADIADLKADWSDTSNPNPVTFGTWSYRQGSTLLPQVANWNGNGTVGFTTTQPAWAPSNAGGNFLPAAFKAKSVPSGVDWQVGDVVVHTTDTANGNSNGPVNFLWTSPAAETVTISGGLWEASVLAPRDNSWSLLVNGVVVSTGASIDGHNRANPFLLNSGTGGVAALTQNVVAGSTIDLQITRTSVAGYFVGANFTITGTVASVPEPGTLVLSGLTATAFALTALTRRFKSGRTQKAVPPSSIPRSV